MAQSRRNFLKLAGLGLVGGLVAPHLISCESMKNAPGSPLKNIGLQLFTLRDLLAQDPKQVLKSVAGIGYTHVETYGADPTNGTLWGVSVDELKKILNDNNLKSHSGHYDLGKYLDKDSKDKENIEKYIEIAHNLGQQYIIAPVPPMHRLNQLNQSDYQYMAEQLNKAGEMSEKAGITMGYHNHFWEFKQFGNNTNGLDVLLAFTDPKLVVFELDMYWISKAGERPQKYFEHHKGRFPLWHIKDMDRNFSVPLEQNKINPKTGKPDTLDMMETMKDIKYAEVGTGSIDFINLAQYANESGLKYAFVEQDEIYSNDKYGSIKKSFDYMQKNFK
ncbi:sugar phosphate isomerase/epimerase family protein [Sphingobacterium lactis]|uniref:Sugar phosphate isomerase/epimerase n=1 Tax=Sphingobacterium lactis TaxID=797291 RepID=A0A1H5RRP1_9SPHI|nr:sugar phosphate isomerase/epimerase [Sphingobacterium lactis]SEF40940.1 Sugar phosphate isomerase/epimerase [Sphingobacterium lactis]